MGYFAIDADEFHWIDDTQDDPEDLCLHARVTAQIGDVSIEEYATVSATALYLLKSIEEDHIIDKSIQMLPCCGHFLVASGDLSEVDILGCNIGYDWSVIHDGDKVKLILPDGRETIVPLTEYKSVVFGFADKVEAFYNVCSPKVIPNDEFDRNGYIAFWNEWHRRREKN